MNPKLDYYGAAACAQQAANSDQGPIDSAGSAARTSDAEASQNRHRQSTMTGSHSNFQQETGLATVAHPAPLSVAENALAAGDPASAKPLPDDDLDYIAEQEAVVGALIHVMAKEKATKSAGTEVKREVEKAGIKAAMALHQIRRYVGKGPLGSHSTIERYCKAKWELGKSHAYRLLAVGSFIARFESQSPKKTFGDWLPVGEGQIRPMLAAVPECKHVECWAEIVAKTSPDRLSGKMVRSAAMEFMRLQSDGQVSKPQHNVGIRIAKPLGKIRAEFAGTVELVQCEHLLALVLELAERIDGSTQPFPATRTADTEICPGPSNGGIEDAHTVVPIVAPQYVITSGQEGDTPASSATTKARSKPRQGAGSRTKQVIDPVKVDEGVLSLDAYDESVKGAGPLDGPSQNSYMSLALFYSVLNPSVAYDEFLAKIQRDRPDFLQVPHCGGEALIYLEWAKALAFECANTPESRTAMQLVVSALNDYPVGKGAAADVLFANELKAQAFSRDTAAAGTFGTTPQRAAAA